MSRLRTLGGKSKVFDWKYLDEILTIKKEQKNGSTTVCYTLQQIQQIATFIRNNGPTPLANSVDKLYESIEKKGIGTYIYNELELKIPNAQSASQLMAILVNCGIANYNGKLRGMEFWIDESSISENIEKKLISE